MIDAKDILSVILTHLISLSYPTRWLGVCRTMHKSFIAMTLSTATTSANVRIEPSANIKISNRKPVTARVVMIRSSEMSVFLKRKIAFPNIRSKIPQTTATL